MATIGEKIRKIRKEQHLTQAALAGDRITRNMLSQIENDVASPSVQTILYLSHKLDMPAGYFLSPEEDEAIYLKNRDFRKMKELFRDRKYAACVYMQNQLGEADDEIHYLLSVCHYHLGADDYRRGRLKKAQEHFKLCLQHCTETIYPFEEAKEAERMLSVVASFFQQEPLVQPVVPCGYDSGEKRLAVRSVYLYLSKGRIEEARTLLSGFDFLDEVLYRLLLCGIYEADRQYEECIRESIRLEALETDAVNKCFIYSMEERCAVAMNDFERAYRFTQKKAKLEKQMNR